MTADEEAMIMSDEMELVIKPVRRKAGMVLIHVELPPAIFPIMDRTCRRARCNREQFIIRAIKARLDALDAMKRPAHADAINTQPCRQLERSAS